MKSKFGYLCDKDGYAGHTGDINPFKNAMPKVMVFCFQPELTHSVWVDFSHRYRTVSSLIKHLKKSVKRGDYIGYRIITVHKEVMGIQA